MFMQILQGTVRDEAGARATMDRWTNELQPGAAGWLGATYGITAAGELVACVRFASRDDARRNSERPEQTAWWHEMEQHFTGAVTFHDCDDVMLLLGGGSDEAGFVQVIQGRVRDVGRLHELTDEAGALLAEYRKDILGATLAIDADGFCTETVCFTSEAAAREAESRPVPSAVQALVEEEMALFEQASYLDLREPAFASLKR